MAARWTAEEMDKLYSMRTRGESIKYISGVLQKSEAAVWHHLGLMKVYISRKRMENERAYVPNVSNGTIAQYLKANPLVNDEQAAKDCEVPVSTIIFVRNNIDFHEMKKKEAEDGD